MLITMGYIGAITGDCYQDSCIMGLSQQTEYSSILQYTMVFGTQHNLVLRFTERASVAMGNDVMPYRPLLGQ